MLDTAGVVLKDRRPADVHLTLCLTHDCNLRCRYCYSGTKSPRHMELAIGKLAIERAILSARGRLHLIFFGGEPLLRWEALVELTEHARGRAGSAGLVLRPTVTSNGTLLSQERAQWLRQQGFTVAISCDGCQAAHDASRCDAAGRGSHAATVAGIRTALEAGLELRVVLVIDPSNVVLLSESVAFLASLGVHDLVVNPNWSANWSDAELRSQWTRAYERMADLYVSEYRRNTPLWVSVIDGKIATHIPYWTPK